MLAQAISFCRFTMWISEQEFAPCSIDRSINSVAGYHHRSYNSIVPTLKLESNEEQIGD